ncbi:tyrosine-type recombinase/integrase (plasmid) [Dyella sp. BiH032]|uniref:tyrosine-type recombinase/integrase n=1 Tax=Dyella sp. BiH032 TaxID=3075430 RepID=UPI002893473D|nr:tyrosine-type recombinase/integrase [Dyella sp. BiH032]WNL48374.1 tyrosine-type recombinase/integrase [Dyella sp. BiH032]
MTELLVVDSLQDLHDLAAVAPAAFEPVVAVPSAPALLERLRAWEADFHAGQARATVAAVRADWLQYIDWCEAQHHTPLPADVDQLASFINNALIRGRKLSTLKRYVYTVGLIHEAAGLPSPAKDARWKRKWGAIKKQLAERAGTDGEPDNGNLTRQAGELLTDDITTILATLGTHPRDRRDAAMLKLASDTLARESELVAVRVEHLHFNRARGSWSLWLPRSKSNQTGERRDYRHVSEETMACIRAWQAAAGIDEGLLFRPVGGRPKRRVQTALEEGREPPVVALGAKEVARIFRRRAIQAGLTNAWSISGHSTRVGTANDLINGGATIAQIMDAGGWRSAEMVAVYTRRSQAGANAVAELRARQRARGGTQGR